VTLPNRSPAFARPSLAHPAPATRAHVLLLGGTHEARALAERIAATPQIEGVVSLAGRTSAPLPQALPARIGGFGGAEGLAAYLTQQNVTHVIDATHPFAAQMSINAREACAQIGLPLLRLTRAPWRPLEGDNWIEVADNAAAAQALGAKARRVFLTIGRQGVSAFRAAPQHTYLLRVIDPPDRVDLPPLCTVIADRGPFTRDSEIALMRAHELDVVVSKNSGGPLTYAKIEAARALGLPVVMIAPPKLDDVCITHDLDVAMAFLAS
jgi:precorrin-6A/cobalt-precorrin-6A reductase